MRLSTLLPLISLPLVIFAAKSAPSNTFEKYHTKFLSSAPIKLNDASYDELTTSPRDYAAVVLLTAMEARFGCQLCREFQPEWDVIGKSWLGGDKRGESRTVYGTLDFTDGKGTFQKVERRLLCGRLC